MFNQIQVNVINKWCIIRSFHISNLLFKTHYETLKVSSNCTDKEIKDAFFKLSKEIHPDKNQLKDSTTDFVRLNEAYQALKPGRRQGYDYELRNPHFKARYKYDVRQHPIFWEGRDRSKDQFYASKPYYGIKGVKRMTNSQIVMLCLIFAAMGVGLQVIAIRRSFTFKREILDKQSSENSEILSAVRETARKNGNELQRELIAARIEKDVKSFSNKSRQPPES